MDNKNTRGSSLIISLLLSLFAVALLMFLMLHTLRAADYRAFPAVLIFALVNCVAIMAVYGFSGTLSHAVGLPAYTVAAFMTFLYTVADFVYMWLSGPYQSAAGYTITQLIMLFVYAVITCPVVISGINRNRNKK